MPIIIDPNKPGPPPPGDSAVSADGILYATRFVEVSHDWNGAICKRRSRVEGDFCTPAGVYLVADFSFLSGEGTDAVPEQILNTNFYRDPSQEFGIAPYTGALTGPGATVLDLNDFHTGLQSVKVTNNAALSTTTNLALRPNPTGTAGGWTAIGASTATRVNDVIRRAGTWSLRGAPNPPGGVLIGSFSNIGTISSAVAGRPAVTAGQTYTMSLWWQATQDNCPYFFRANFFDASNVQVGSAMVGPTVTPTAPAGTWNRASWTITVPAGAVCIAPLFQINAPSGASTALDQCWITDFQLEAGPAATPYFDGDMTSDATYTYAWTGTPAASTSTRFGPPTLPTPIVQAGVSVGTAASMGWQVGDVITMAGWVKVPLGATPYVSGQRNLAFSLGGTAFAASVDADAPTARNSWVRVSVTNTVTNAAGTVIPSLYGPAFRNDAVWFDDFSFTRNPQGTVPSVTIADFNGNTPASGTTNYRWTGTPGGSSSQQFIPGTPAVPPDQTKWPQYVRFVRLGRTSPDPGTPDIPDQPVRGADPAIAVGGIARAYDLEAPADQPSQWVAIPIFRDGSEGDPSLPVAITATFPEGNLDCWIKPTGDPLLVTLVQIIDPFPEFLRAARNYLSTIQGSPYPAGGWDVRIGFTATFSFWTPDWVERDRILAALSAGPILVQARPAYLIPDFYALPGDLTESYLPTTMEDPGRLWSVPITVIDRPDTADSPLVIPCRSYADVHDIVQSVAGTDSDYTDRRNIFPTYADAGRPEGALLP